MRGENSKAYGASLRQESLARIRDAVASLRASGSFPLSKKDVVLITGLSRTTVHTHWQEAVGDDGISNMENDSERRALIRKKAWASKVRETDARIADAIETLKSEGKKATIARIARLAGCGTAAVRRRLKTESSVNASRRLDRKVADAVTALAETGSAVTPDAVVDVIGTYLPNIVQSRVRRALDAGRAAA